MQRRKIIAILLVLVFVITIMPARVFAEDQKVMTAEQFVSCLKKALKRNTTYNNVYPYNLGYYNGSTISWDCWNLGKSILWSRGTIVDNYTVGNHANPDTSFGLGDWTGETIIHKAPNCNSDFSALVPGEWLYLSGHTGYYIGDGQVIECTASWGAWCVVQSQIDSNGNRSKDGAYGEKWTYHGMVPWIDYSGVLCQHNYGDTGYCSKCKTWAPFTDTSARTGIYKVKSGKTAHFRTQPYGAASEIQQLSAGTQFNVTGAVKNYFNNLWYKVSYNGKTGYIVDTNVEFYKNVTYPITISPAQTSYTIKQGSVCSVTGSITSEGIITRVTATLDGSKYVDYNPNSTSVNIGDSSAGRINSFRAQDLSVGTHYLVIGAENATMCYSKTITITVTGSSSTVYPITISPAQTSYTIKQGNICSVTGSITSSAKITRVTATLDGSKYVDYNPNATSVNIGDSSAGRINSFRAQDLSVGTHSLVIYAENSTTNATKTITITVTGTSSTSYTDEIGHWAWGFQNQEGNNHNKKGFKIGETTFSKVSGSSFTLSGGDAITIPNGYYLDKVIGTSSVTGSWQAFDMPSTFSQKSYVMHFQYDYYPITYNITYVLNGGTNHADNPSTYNVLYGVTFKEPTRSGYSFAGWTTNGSSIKGINVGKNAAFSSENDLYVQLSSRMTGDLTVTANWKKKETGKVLPFTDVTKSKSYYDAVYWAYFAGIVKGKSETRFAPGDSLTRGEFCTMLWRMFGKQSVDGLTCPFADAKKSNHYKAILWCYNQGIINGYKVNGKQVFKPSNTITRGNIIVMLFKLAKQEKSYKPATIKNPYTDVKSTNKNISAYKWAYENGVTTAKKLSPSTACKRSAMVSFLYGYNNTYKVVK